MEQSRRIARLPFYLLVGFCFLLTSWWIFFQVRASHQIEQSRLHAVQLLTHKALVDFAPVMRVQHEPSTRRASIDKILARDYPQLELFADKLAKSDEARLAPFLPPTDPLHDLVVRVRQSTIETILAEGRSTRLMFFSEGGVFLLVLLVGAFLFYRAIQRELTMHAQHELFLRSATHELKTPLAALKLGLQSLAQGRMDPDRSREYLELLEGQVDRLEFEIENMLLIAEGREKGLEKVPGNPAEDVTAVVDEFAARARGREIEFEVTGEGQGLLALRDPLTFRQALRNVLDNAIKYSPIGGSIRIDVSGGDRSARIRIQDAGPGVPELERSKIFQKFFRGETGSSDAIGGTGLGLFFVNEAMQAHGGSVQLVDNGEPGACFVLSLPLAGSAKAGEPS